jgi:hypothetical protein
MTDPRPRTSVRWRSDEELEAVSAAASGEPVSTWLRRIALEAAGRPDLVPEPEASVVARRLRVGG